MGNGQTQKIGKQTKWKLLSNMLFESQLGPNWRTNYGILKTATGDKSRRQSHFSLGLIFAFEFYSILPAGQLHGHISFTVSPAGQGSVGSTSATTASQEWPSAFTVAISAAQVNVGEKIGSTAILPAGSVQMSKRSKK